MPTYLLHTYLQRAHRPSEPGNNRSRTRHSSRHIPTMSVFRCLAIHSRHRGNTCTKTTGPKCTESTGALLSTALSTDSPSIGSRTEPTGQGYSQHSNRWSGHSSVSYTHLTLPTIYSV